ncbi:hypothetical protein QTQ03_06150 [Micromonospora sp. WMMA1363]|uniref:hypothetical protein n=1 Tax=Micromonospora sp. WMMA1363 TaxID=3053985 RepID=UPI00259CD368|nr:hypothetical protein [Micromonospora sp. WMMA1363]MDM4719199.1 hypothetical protein [Micromonospora sp. WMMA1363]
MATLVVGLRSTRVFDNPLAWFLGLIGSFAPHASDELDGAVVLMESSGVGAAAALPCPALPCQQLQRRLVR